MRLEKNSLRPATQTFRRILELVFFKMPMYSTHHAFEVFGHPWQMCVVVDRRQKTTG